MKKKLIIGFISLLTLFVLIQLIPYGKNHSNPNVIAEPIWEGSQTRALFMKACGDCHSNETRWPAYSNVAPASWVISHHVEEGREHFNISNWGHQNKNHGDEAAEELEEGEMPMAPYVMMHPESKLTAKETNQLLLGLVATFGEEDKGDEHNH